MGIFSSKQEPDAPGDRDWKKSDEYNDRPGREAPVSKHHWGRNNTQVDAVPELHYRPGRRN